MRGAHEIVAHSNYIVIYVAAIELAEVITLSYRPGDIGENLRLA